MGARGSNRSVGDGIQVTTRTAKKETVHQPGSLSCITGFEKSIIYRDSLSGRSVKSGDQEKPKPPLTCFPNPSPSLPRAKGST